MHSNTKHFIFNSLLVIINFIESIHSKFILKSYLIENISKLVIVFAILFGKINVSTITSLENIYNNVFFKCWMIYIVRVVLFGPFWAGH